LPPALRRRCGGFRHARAASAIRRHAPAIEDDIIKIAFLIAPPPRRYRVEAMTTLHSKKSSATMAARPANTATWKGQCGISPPTAGFQARREDWLQIAYYL
jgi:hypothetical protein